MRTTSGFGSYYYLGSYLCLVVDLKTCLSLCGPLANVLLQQDNAKQSDQIGQKLSNLENMHIIFIDSNRSAGSPMMLIIRCQGLSLTEFI